MQDIHKRIAYAREMAGLTQNEVAAHFGIQRVSVAQWESGRTRPSIEKIGGLAALLNTTPDWLISGKGEPPKKVERKKEDRELFTPEIEREFLSRLRKADPNVRNSILLLLGLRLKP